MKKNIVVLLSIMTLLFFGKAYSQINQEEEVIIEKPAEDSADINTFYDDLSSDGEWIGVDKSAIDSEDNLEMSETVDIDEDVISDYVWRPSVSISFVDWNPYTFGHWEFCRFGWVWVSDYNWGWAPYHYGRWWFSHRWGWVWSPGHRWAANWVSWCHTRNHIGWHPISPRTPWRYHNGVIVTHPVTPKQKSITNKWTFVNKTDFNKPITKNNTIDLKNNKQVVSDAKISSSGNEVYNTGPKRKDIEKSTGETLSKKNVTFKNVKTGSVINSTKKNDPVNTNNNYNNKSYNKQTKKDGTVKTNQNGTKRTKSHNGNNNTKKESGTKKDNSGRNSNTKKEQSWISTGNESTKTRSSNSNHIYKTSTSNNSYKSSTPNNSYKNSNSNSSNSYRNSNSSSNRSGNSNSSHNSSRSSSTSHSSNTSKSSNSKR
jgi:hypothetical protein